MALYVRGRTGTESSSGNLYVTVYDEQGRLYGNAVGLGIGTSADGTARVVNNLAVAQRLYLAVFNPNSLSDVLYSVAIALEQ